MENKYEVLYWDYYVGKETTVTYTDSFLKAMWLVRKYEKMALCINKVSQKQSKRDKK